MSLKLPDKTILTDERKQTILSGLDHYWRFHDKYKEWVKYGCPICIGIAEDDDD